MQIVAQASRTPLTTEVMLLHSPLPFHLMSFQAYFESIPGVSPCPPGTNPCSFAINVIGDGVSTHVGPPRDFGFEYEVRGLQ